MDWEGSCRYFVVYSKASNNTKCEFSSFSVEPSSLLNQPIDQSPLPTNQKALAGHQNTDRRLQVVGLVVLTVLVTAAASLV